MKANWKLFELSLLEEMADKSSMYTTSSYKYCIVCVIYACALLVSSIESEMGPQINLPERRRR